MHAMKAENLRSENTIFRDNLQDDVTTFFTKHAFRPVAMPSILQEISWKR